jgi:hypothetical protein
MTDTIDDVAAAAQEEPAAVSGPGAHPPKAGAVLPTHFRTAIQQDSSTPATSSKSPDVSTASPDPATQVGTAVDAGQRSTRLRVPLIWGVVFGFLNAVAPWASGGSGQRPFMPSDSS